MLSHVSRAHTVRAESLRQLEAASIKPRIIESHATTRSDAEVRRRAYDAFSFASEDTDGLVFFEDDIYVNAPLLNRQLTTAVNLGEVVALCALRLSLYPPGIRRQIERGEQPREGIYELVNHAAYRGFHGSQAVYLPPDLITYALDRPQEFMDPDGKPLTVPSVPADVERGKVTGFDFWLKCRVDRMFVAVPNPVDHADAPTVNGPPRNREARSPCYLPPS